MFNLKVDLIVFSNEVTQIQHKPLEGISRTDEIIGSN